MDNKENKTLNVPTLRFREFTDNWKLIPIKKMLRFQNGINADSTKYGKGIKYISVSDILNNQYITYGCIKGLIDIDEKTFHKFIVEYGDILFQRSSETFEDIGRANVYLDKEHSATFGGFVIRGKKISDYNPLFFRYLLCTHNARKQTVRMGAGAQHYNIGQEGLEKICLYFPCLQEQQKISDLLSAIDNKIAVQNKIIEYYESLIKGISNHLLCKIEDCPTIKLSDILIEYNDKARQNNEYPILSSTMNGIFVQSEYFNKQAASEETVGYKKVPYGYCTYRSMSDTGEFRFNIQKIVEIGIVSPAYPVFTSVEYDMQFIVFYLNNSARLRKQILEIKEGGTRFALPFSKLRSLTIPKITRLQQTKIVDIYCLFSRKKELEQRFLLKLKEQKDYLLSKMFI
ncbi:MAG: restriction endonuclease subunit S [Bacilli bacterium]|nr:restriction endonuclease subunit S [Bacilli bacterium]